MRMTVENLSPEQSMIFALTMCSKKKKKIDIISINKHDRH